MCAFLNIFFFIIAIFGEEARYGDGHINHRRRNLIYERAHGLGTSLYPGPAKRGKLKNANAH